MKRNPKSLNEHQANIAEARGALAVVAKQVGSPAYEKAVEDLRAAKEAERVFIFKSKPAFTEAGRVIRH